MNPAPPAETPPSACPASQIAPAQFQPRSVDKLVAAKRLRMLRQVEADAPSKAGLFRRVYSSAGRVSPRQAIKAQCLQCCWMEEAAIRECTDTACPLWSFRPYRDGTAAGRRSAGLESPPEAIPFSDAQRGREQTTRQGPHLGNAMRGDAPSNRPDFC